MDDGDDGEDIVDAVEETEPLFRDNLEKEFARNGSCRDVGNRCSFALPWRYMLEVGDVLGCSLLVALALALISLAACLLGVLVLLWTLAGNLLLRGLYKLCDLMSFGFSTGFAGLLFGILSFSCFLDAMGLEGSAALVPWFLEAGFIVL